MTEIGWELWLAAAVVLPWALEWLHVPRWVPALVVPVVLIVGFLGWWFSFNISVPHAVGRPLKLALVVCVIIGFLRQSIVAVRQPPRSS